MTRRLRRCFTLLSLCAALPLVGGALATPAQAASPSPVQAAAGWLTTQFVDDATSCRTRTATTSRSPRTFPNYGENADVIFALSASKSGAASAKFALGYLANHLADYADTAGAFGGPFDGSIAKVAVAELVAGTTADDLLTRLKSDECTAPSCTPGSPAAIFTSVSDSYVILAEARAGGSFAPSPAAVDYFLSLQCSNGGFTTRTTACGSGAADIDATSFALMALQALGGHPNEVSAAADWLTAQRQPAGYWVSQHIPNTNSTGLAAAALAGAGRDVSTSRAWLLSQQIPAGHPGAGALRYDATFAPTTTSATSLNVLATAQGVLGLSDDGSLATLSATGSSVDANLLAPVVTLAPARQKVGATVTAHGVGFAAGERVAGAVSSESVGTGTADPGGVVDLSLPRPGECSRRFARAHRRVLESECAGAVHRRGSIGVGRRDVHPVTHRPAAGEHRHELDGSAAGWIHGAAPGDSLW